MGLIKSKHSSKLIRSPATTRVLPKRRRVGRSAAGRNLVGRTLSHRGSCAVCRIRQADLLLPSDRGAVMGSLHRAARQSMRFALWPKYCLQGADRFFDWAVLLALTEIRSRTRGIRFLYQRLLV